MAGKILLLRLTIKLPCKGRRRGIRVQGRDHFQFVVHILAVGFSFRFPGPPEFAPCWSVVVACIEAELASVYVLKSRDAFLQGDIGGGEPQVLELQIGEMKAQWTRGMWMRNGDNGARWKCAFFDASIYVPHNRVEAHLQSS
jgi:hypothetical protein